MSHCPITLCTTTSRSFNLLPPLKPCPIVPLVYALILPDPLIAFLLQNRVPLSHYSMYYYVQILQSPPPFKTLSHCHITLYSTTSSSFQSPPPFKTVSHCPITICTTTSGSFNLLPPSKRRPIVPLLYALLHPVLFNLLRPSIQCPIVPLLYALLRPDPLISSLLQNGVPLSHYSMHYYIQFFSISSALQYNVPLSHYYMHYYVRIL
jgi:hypothetical protein